MNVGRIIRRNARALRRQRSHFVPEAQPQTRVVNTFPAQPEAWSEEQSARMRAWLMREIKRSRLK